MGQEFGGGCSTTNSYIGAHHHAAFLLQFTEPAGDLLLGLSVVSPSSPCDLQDDIFKINS